MEALLEGGANRGNKDVLGKSAKDLSSTHGHKNVNLLLAGSKVPSEWVWMDICYWRASKVSETLSGVTQSRFRYIYLFIWYVRTFSARASNCIKRAELSVSH